MATQALTWDDAGTRLYETGTSKGVLYPMNPDGTYAAGVAWNGLTAVTEKPSGAEETALYGDDIKYASLRSAEEFAGTIEAYTYPDEFAACDGSVALGVGVTVAEQTRQKFGMSYRTILGNDVASDAYGYKIHLIYGATAAPSERSYASVNDKPDAIKLSWDITSDKVAVPKLKPTASITINSTTVTAAHLTATETMLYGSTTAAAKLPLPSELATLIAALKQKTIERSFYA